jgi:hypothetical protein
MTKRKEIPLAANVVKIPIGEDNSMTDEELEKRINQLFVKYCCGGIEKSVEETPDYIKVCRNVFANGYKAGHNDLLYRFTHNEWEDLK